MKHLPHLKSSVAETAEFSTDFYQDYNVRYGENVWEKLGDNRMWRRRKDGLFEPIPVPEDVVCQRHYLEGRYHKKKLKGYKDPSLSLSEDYLLGQKDGER